MEIENNAYAYNLQPITSQLAFRNHDSRWASGLQENGARQSFCSFGDGEDLLAGCHMVGFDQDACEWRHCLLMMRFIV